jgi:hypothetical protein
MTFGQASGPSASTQQVAELIELLRQAGYDGFREARHPFGLSQRQSNGKFTRDEAGALIDRLANGEATPADEPTPDVVLPDAVAMAFPDELLAEELTRRGWTCSPPSSAKKPPRPAAPPRQPGQPGTDQP